jgi:hypothetical protein
LILIILDNPFFFRLLYIFQKFSSLLIHGLVKSLQGNDGDIIDCVDIYQQPAFDHPLLKNHTIQVLNIRHIRFDIRLHDKLQVVLILKIYILIINTKYVRNY